MHNESRSELQTDTAEDVGVSRTFSIHKSESDAKPREATFTFVTTVGLTELESDAYWRLTDRRALQTALDTGAVNAPGVYLVCVAPDDDASDYQLESVSGTLLTVTTTPRIQD